MMAHFYCYIDPLSSPSDKTFWIPAYTAAGNQASMLYIFSCSTQLSMKFQLLIKTKMMKNKMTFLALKLSYTAFINVYKC